MRAIGLLLLAGLLIGAASFLVQGPLPGDVALTTHLQANAGNDARWPLWLTETAKPPTLLATMMLAAALAFAFGGLRAAAAVPLAYSLAWLSDRLFRMLIFVSRPDAELVEVVAPASTSGLPSTFGLVYGALFGAALMIKEAAPLQRAIRVALALMLLAGLCARVIPGAHWPSQMLASIVFGIGLAAASVWLCSKLPPMVNSTG